jgi:hypothetical protein
LILISIIDFFDCGTQSEAKSKKKSPEDVLDQDGHHDGELGRLAHG